MKRYATRFMGCIEAKLWVRRALAASVFGLGCFFVLCYVPSDPANASIARVFICDVVGFALVIGGAWLWPLDKSERKR